MAEFEVVSSNCVNPSPDETRSCWSEPLHMAGLLDKPPPPIPWFSRHRIPHARGSVITGIGGSSKTTCLYHLAFGAVIGSVPWGWPIDQRGRSVLVMTEDIEDDAHRALHAIASGLNLTSKQKRDVESMLLPFPLAGKDLKLLFRNQRGVLEKTHTFHELMTLIDALGDVVYAAIDPALSVTEGDELNQNDQRALGKLIDDLAVSTNTTVMLAAHATKGSQQLEELSTHNSRGGGAITDAVRAEYAMRTMTKAEAKGAGITDLEERKRHVQMVATKGNHLPPSAYVPVWLRRGDHGVLMPADIALAERKSGLHNGDMKAYQILVAIAEKTTPMLHEWRQRCMDAGLLTQESEQARAKAMERIVFRLTEAGKVERGFARGAYQPVNDQ